MTAAGEKTQRGRGRRVNAFMKNESFETVVRMNIGPLATNFSWLAFGEFFQRS